MDLKQLRYFLAVAEERSFSRAAERLHMSQPPLSQQIMKLEESLGMRLFSRTTRQFELTPAGRALVVEARAVLAHMDLAINTVRQINRGERGRLRIGIIGSAVWGALGQVLNSFAQQFPNVETSLHELDPSSQYEGLRMRNIDLGFWRVPLSDATSLEQDGLQQLVFCREDFVLAVHEKDVLARRKRVSLTDLADRPLLSLKPERSTSARYLIQCCADAGFVPRIAHELEEPQTMMALVGMGHGVAFAPASAARIVWPHVKFVQFGTAAPTADLCIAHRRGDDMPALEAFLNIARCGPSSTAAS